MTVLDHMRRVEDEVGYPARNTAALAERYRPMPVAGARRYTPGPGSSVTVRPAGAWHTGCR
jgi:hypothetical protein